MIGLQGLEETLKKLSKGKPAKGQHFSLGELKVGREFTAQYMGGERWRITVKKASEK